MPNWEKIEQLRDILKSQRDTEYKQFNMGIWMLGLSGKARDALNGNGPKSVTIAELRANGQKCGTAACLAGETVIQFASERFRLYGENLYIVVPKRARRILELTENEATFMFRGHWTNAHWSTVTRQQAVQYLTKAIKSRNVIVYLYS